MNPTDTPKPEEKVCYNCHYLTYYLGEDHCLRCGHETKTGMCIFNLHHSCSYFEYAEIKYLDDDDNNPDK